VSQKGILFFYPDILPPSGYWLSQKSQLVYKVSLKKSNPLKHSALDFHGLITRELVLIKKWAENPEIKP